LKDRAAAVPCISRSKAVHPGCSVRCHRYQAADAPIESASNAEIQGALGEARFRAGDAKFREYPKLSIEE
jgi:hypothetical protein